MEVEVDQLRWGSQMRLASGKRLHNDVKLHVFRTLTISMVMLNSYLTMFLCQGVANKL